MATEGHPSLAWEEEIGGLMKKQLRDKRPIKGHPLEEVFADFEAMTPTEGERRTRKPAKATIASAGTKSQRDAATRARKTANPTTARAKKAIQRARLKGHPIHGI